MSSRYASVALSADRPFPGLRPFRFEDHDFFFGRDDQISALYRLFDHGRFVAVVGSSGSGKSSLVLAGLLPLLEAESREPTGRTWKRMQMHPGDAPIGSLAGAMAEAFFPADDPNISAARQERMKFALRRSSFGMSDALRDIEGLGKTSIILVVDQFEELFRYAGRPQGPDAEEEASRYEEATQFVQILLAASRDRALNVYVLITMRSDFIGDCAGFRGLSEMVSASQFLVPSLSRDQRERAIRGPVERAGAKIEPELVERLLNDSGEELDQLPVLQHCLARIWERASLPATSAGADGRCLTAEHYRDVGGMTRALSQHADEILTSLPGAELAVEQTFRALAEIDFQGRIVRRARLFNELRDETGVAERDLRTVVDRFRDDDCSFLTPSRSEVPSVSDASRIDVGHEALLRRWERVSGDPRTGSEFTGWLRAEETDGRDYRVLLTMAESKAGRIPLDQIESRLQWWRQRPRTAAWAERYGGHIGAVEELFSSSLAELKAEAARREAEEAAERRRIELEAEAARAREEAERTRLELAAQTARERELGALRVARLARRAALGVTALLCITVALGVVSYRQWRSALTERNNVQNALKLGGDLTKDLLSRVKAYLNDGSVSVKTAKDLLNTAQNNLVQLQKAEQTPAIQEMRANLLLGFADLYSALQDDSSALQYSMQAQELAMPLVQADPGNSDYQTLLYSAAFRVGDAQSDLSHFNDGLKAYAAALAIAQTMALKDPARYAWMQDQAFILNKIADIDKIRGESNEALKQYQAALAIDQTLAHDHPSDDTVQRDLATTATRIGDLQKELGNLAAALENFKNALSIRKDIAGRAPDDASLQSNLSVAYNRVADVLVAQHDYDGAAPLYQAALAIRQNLAGSDPTNTTWQSYLAFEYVYIGNMLLQKGDAAGATGSYRQSLRIRKLLVAHDAKNFTFLKNLADSHTALGNALLAEDNLPEALNEHRAALAERRMLAAQYPNSATRQRELIKEYVAIGDILAKQGDSASAAAAYQQAADVIKAFYTSHPGNKSLDAESQTVSARIAAGGPTEPQQSNP